MNLDNIKAFAIDVDGTLTNGLYHVGEDGVISKSFNTLDFFAINKIVFKGYKVLIITQSDDGVIEEKLTNINSSNLDLLTGSEKKIDDVEFWLKENNIKWEELMYIGDADNDLECMKKSGICACPNTIVESVWNISKIKAPIKGGEGAVYWILQELFKKCQKEW